MPYPQLKFAFSDKKQKFELLTFFVAIFCQHKLDILKLFIDEIFVFCQKMQISVVGMA